MIAKAKSKGIALISVLVASVTLNAVILVFAVLHGTFARLAQMALPKTETQVYLHAMYAGLPATKDGLLLVGDSLTYNAPYADLVGRLHNRGIPGDTSLDIVQRLDDLRRNRADTTVIGVGINDILHELPAEKIVTNIGTLVDSLDNNTRRLVVVAALPINANLSGASSINNSKVRLFNLSLASAIEKRHNIYFCDFSPLLVDSHRDLKEAFTADGIHLNAEGYLQIAPAIKAFLAGGRTEVPQCKYIP